jgi:3-methyladenine DNA glycosylase AlkD
MLINIKELEDKMLKSLLAAGYIKEVINDERWQKYINTSLVTLGIDAATQRNLAKKGYVELKELDLNEQLLSLSELFKQSQILEIKNQCLIFLDLRKKKILKAAHWPILKEWVKYVDNWAHSDGLSSVFSIMLQNDLELIYPQLVTWNKSKNPWERRQSIVCLFYYSRTRKHFLPFEVAIELINNLLDDKEYYVQKGLGWALREASNVYYDYTLDYILQNAKTIKPAAFSAATEKLLPHHKEQVKMIRKKKSTF